jgi:hypothetical protein
MALAGLVPESLSLRPAARTVGLLFSPSQFRFQSTGILLRRVLVPGLLAQFVGWRQLLIRTSRGLNTEINATHPCTYNDGFLASSESFLVARGNMVSEYFSGGKNSRNGDPWARYSPQGVTRLASLDSLATNGLGRGGIARRPRSSIASIAFGPRAYKRITNAAASGTRTTASKDRPPEKRRSKLWWLNRTGRRQRARKSFLVFRRLPSIIQTKGKHPHALAGD